MSERGDSWGHADGLQDQAIRSAAFAFLIEQTRLHGDVLPRGLLASGFRYGDDRVPLLGPQGIFKPRLLEVPLSITTVPVVEGRDRPYDDELSPDNLLTYRYRGTDPSHRDNVGLRLAMQRQAPLIYFYGLVPGQYLAVWPVYVVRDDQRALAFTVAVDSHEALASRIADGASLAAEGRRQYVTQVTQRRLHQESFRWRVLRAYRECCAVCRLRHSELLDAAHILPDGHPKGEPIVPNGLALCKLHHAAFDNHMLGVRPDLVIQLRRDILEEADGPMLQFGLQGFHGKTIHAPRLAELRPSEDFLAERFDLFHKAS
jgi:putative restriction endonuclease